MPDPTPMLTGSFAEAMRRVEEKREAAPEPRLPKKRLLRRSGLATLATPTSGVAALRTLAFVYLIGQKPDV